MESIKEIEQELKKVLNVEYDEILNNYKKEFIREMIKKYNLLNIKSHKLHDEQNYNKEGLNFKSLMYKEDFKFKEVENLIKEEFKQYDKKDRIKEIMFYLSYEKVFNKDKNKYFSLWDFKKNKTKEQLKQEITTDINNLKEIPLSWNTDKYYIQEYLNHLKELLNLLFDIKINFTYEYKENNYKVYEEQINASNDLIKIKCFKEWFYISFKNKQQEQIFKNLLIEQMTKRIDFD
jgi:hypothetical protein